MVMLVMVMCSMAVICRRLKLTMIMAVVITMLMAVTVIVITTTVAMIMTIMAVIMTMTCSLLALHTSATVKLCTARARYILIRNLNGGVINAHRSTVRCNTLKHSIAIFARLRCDMGSQDRHARLDSPDMQVMHFCYTIHLQSYAALSVSLHA